ncbi:MAG: insulinase family protein, partial [Bacteroidota bacterium]
FGSHHPYGYNSYPKTYGSLEREDLLQHFRRNFVASKCQIFLSGCIRPDTIELLNRYIGRQLPVGEREVPVFPSDVQSPLHKKIERPGTVQTAIRIGRRLFNRSHPDYHGVYVLNTILGGYFGSRLMANIREDKGYTYNIFSTMDVMNHDGYFYIGTEVGNDFVGATVQEIYKEMNRLCEQPIGLDELEMVRSFLLGHLLTMLDGAFNAADLLKMYVIRNVPFEAFTELVHTIKTIQPETIRQMAEKYLSKQDHWEVVVGV